MATTLTRNLKLRINSNLTADAKYNLERLDTLGSTFLVDTTDELDIRSKGNITIEPESADIGGSGTGGTVSIGNASHMLDAINLFATEVNIDSPLSLLDQAVGGDKYLELRYKSDISGSVDTGANRTLSVDLDGSDRSLVLGGNLSTAGGAISLTATDATVVTLPLTGTLATLAGVETFTNKTIDANLNTILNIDYSNLDLTNSIMNSDINTNAAIAYSKLALSNSIVNADINAAAAIAYSKLNLALSLVNADVSASAAIAGSKINPAFGTQVVSTTDRFRLNNGSNNTDIQYASAGQVANLLFRLPPNHGSTGQILSTDGSGNMSWTSAGAGTGNVSGFGGNWLNADGTNKLVTHSLGATDVDVTVIDLDTDELINVESIVVTDANSITLNASEAPATNWRVIVQAKP